MPKNIIIYILLLCCVVLYADDLDDKVRQLQRLQNQLETAEKKAKQTSEKKKKTESEIQRTSSLKKITEQNLIKFRKEERVIRDSLSEVQRRLVMAEDRLQALNTAQNAELNMLLRVDRSFNKQGIKHRDHQYLKQLVTQGRRSIDIMTGYKISLEQAKQIHSAEAVKVTKIVRQEDSKNKQYNSKIQTLTKQTKALTKEEKELQASITKLKKDASALEGLISQLMKDSGKTPSTYKFSGAKISWPLRGKIIRSFGEETRSYNTSVVSNGIDIAAKEGTKVVAADNGEVIFADRYGGQGKLVIIDHKNGFFTLYGYNSDLSVSKGDTVKRGQTIAKSGKTGSASEPSLHFELRKDGKAINPMPYLE